MYAHRSHKLLPRRKFISRVYRHFLYAAFTIGAVLFLGMLGYHKLGQLNWVDSYLNATMILGGMGPVDPMTTDPAKIFAGTYALFSGVVFLVAVGTIFAPVLHRLMHKFHLDEDKLTEEKTGRKK